jgi:hypothetical protein
MALVAAACLAGIAVLMGGLPWRSPKPSAVAAGWIAGQGAGLVAGCWLLGLRPHLPPKEDLDRLFVIIVPVIVGVELAATWSKMPRWLAGSMRLGIVAGVAPILLHGSSYLTGGTAWSPVQTGWIISGLALALGSVWWLLVGLASRTSGLSVPASLAVTCVGAAITVMLSGYATGGQLGIPLAGSLTGASLATLVLAHPSRTTGPIGITVVGLFSLLVIGRFFGELPTMSATLLLFAPLVGWIPEMPFFGCFRARVRSLARVALVILTVAAGGAETLHQFLGQSQSTSESSPNEPTVQDDFDYGR